MWSAALVAGVIAVPAFFAAPPVGTPASAHVSVPGVVASYSSDQLRSSAHSDGGEHRIGTSFVDKSCGFAPASSVSLVLDGQPGGSERTDGNGCSTATVSIDSARQVTVRETGLPVTAGCGRSSV